MTTQPSTSAGSKAPPRQDAPDPSVLLGEWLNAERDAAGGILGINVSEQPDGTVVVRAFGTGDPEPRDWGAVEAVVYTKEDERSAAWAFRAAYDFGFLRTVLAAYHNSGVLVMTSYNVFSDDSGRADYWTREFFHRIKEQP
ncbi:hypothetical protein [Streptomyces natalensis]|uniref:Uncharacterized protein n=1 Tax=Streptomyces natalensis ATCC 27448 TaxID=1240678 RepID=A0A0D7CID8_9ACTN|nr:hypothetical protein [Streptomyces natalensis]KIZ16019.1 hypothetical protein SNA_22545 [Streptomyces natalensis ATCC 27448]